jgi:hypothetical protein
MGHPMDLLPEGNIGGSFYRYTANGEVLINSGTHPVLAVRNYGKGRVVAFAYLEDGFIPSGADPFRKLEEEGMGDSADPTARGIYWEYWEYYYSLLAKAIVWAAGRESGVQIVSLRAQPDDAATVRLALSASAPRKVAVEITGRNEFGAELGSERETKNIGGGETELSFGPTALKPGSGWPGGKAIFNVIVRDPESGSTLNWGSATFQAPRKAVVTLAESATDLYHEGEPLSAVVRASGDLQGLRMRFSVYDDLDRLLTSQTVPARAERYFHCILEGFRGKSASIVAELFDSGDRLVDQLRARPLMVAQAERCRREYNPLVSFGAAKHYFRAVRMKQVRAAAADTGFTWGGRVNNGLNIPRGAFGVYWYDRGPTTPEEMERTITDYYATKDFDSLPYLTKKELYRRTKDTGFLARVPSFHDPEFMKRLLGIVQAVARGKARYNMDYYFVGDEGSLTSYTDPYDFDWSPEALSGFRGWLQQQYGTLDSLNKEWKSAHRSWREVLPFTTEQATKTGIYAPWADHRTFMEISFANAYRKVREAVLAGDPDGHIAVSGTQVTTAYNGCDWYRLDQVIDHFLSYDGGNQWDLHRSFARPRSMIGFWTGYESRGIPLQNAIWTAAIHNVLHPNIFWMLSYLNPDFTYSQSARDMGETFKILRYGGIGKLLMESDRLHDGIALHYSMASVHAASITLNHPERGRRELIRDFAANRDGWVRIIKDLGLQFNFVSYDQVERGVLDKERYRAFILPMSMALSPKEVKAIHDFAANGGIVIADAAAGVMNDHCTWQPEGLLNEFFGIQAAPSAKRKLAGSTIVESDADGDVVSQRQSPGIVGSVTVTTDGALWDLMAESLEGIEIVEPSVRATTGKAFVRIGGAHALVVRQVGRGWAVFLNLLLDRYPRQRADGYGGRGYRAAINAILARLQLRPEIEVLSASGEPIERAQIVRYRFGDSRVLAIVKDNVGVEGVAGRDGVTVYTDANLGKVAREEISIRLHDRSLVHDIVAGKPLGESDLVKTSITVGGALVLGLPSSPCTIRVTVPKTTRLGEPVRVAMRLSTPGKHLIRCHVFGPDGSFIPWYAENQLLSGTTGSFVLSTALNDPPGRYRVTLTDILTGGSAEAEVAFETQKQVAGSRMPVKYTTKNL